MRPAAAKGARSASSLPSFLISSRQARLGEVLRIVGGHLEHAVAGAAVLEDVRDRLPDHGNEDRGRLGRRVRADPGADVDAGGRQDAAGGREFGVKRQVSGLARDEAHIGPGGGADPGELGDLIARPGVVAADELANQVSLHRDRGQAEAEEIVGVPRHAQPLAGHRLAGQFIAEVIQLHGELRQPSQPEDQQAERCALQGKEEHPAQLLKGRQHWHGLHRPQHGNAGDHRRERDPAKHGGDEQERRPGKEPAHDERVPAGRWEQRVREDGLQQEGDGPPARPGDATRRPRVAQLQDDDSDRVRDGPGDDRGAVTARHTKVVLRDEERVQDRETAQRHHEDALREPGSRRFARLGCGGLRPWRVPVPGGHFPHLAECLAGGHRRRRDVLAGQRRAPGDRLQRGRRPPGGLGQPVADRGPQAVGCPDPLGGNRRLGEFVPGRVHRRDQVGQSGQPEQDQRVKDEGEHGPQRRGLVRQPEHACPHRLLERGQDRRHEPGRRRRNRQQDQPRQPPRRGPVRAEQGERHIGQRRLHGKQQVAVPQPQRPGHRKHVQQRQDGQRRDQRHLAKPAVGGAVTRFGDRHQAHDHDDQRRRPPYHAVRLLAASGRSPLRSAPS